MTAATCRQHLTPSLLGSRPPAQAHLARSGAIHVTLRPRVICACVGGYDFFCRRVYPELIDAHVAHLGRLALLPRSTSGLALVDTHAELEPHAHRVEADEVGLRDGSAELRGGSAELRGGSAELRGGSGSGELRGW